MNSLPKTVTRQRRGCDFSPGPSVPQSSTLTTRLPSHPGSATDQCRSALPLKLLFSLLRPPLWWWGTGVVVCLERCADLHIAQLMPLPLTVSCSSKIQIGFTFLVPAHPGCPGKVAVKWLLFAALHHCDPRVSAFLLAYLGIANFSAQLDYVTVAGVSSFDTECFHVMA